MMYIQSLINTNQFELLYKDPIIKLDICLIIDYLVNKDDSNPVELIEFFYVCIKELEKKYGVKCLNYNTNYDNRFKEEAKRKVKNLLLKKKLIFLIF